MVAADLSVVSEQLMSADTVQSYRDVDIICQSSTPTILIYTGPPKVLSAAGMISTRK